MAAIKDGSIKRMIFPPCPTMFIPFCLLKMFIIVGLLSVEFPWSVWVFLYLMSTLTLPAPLLSVISTVSAAVSKSDD